MPRYLPITSLVVVTAALVAFPAAQADHPADPGWLSVHDTEDGPDSDQTGGSVDCLFWVKGHDLPYPNGTLVAHTSGRFGARAVELGAFLGTPQGDGAYSFEAGPFEIVESGDRWTVIADMEGAHTSFSPPFAYTYCDSEDDETSLAPPPACPTDVGVEATSTGNRLTWAMPQEHDGAFRVYRDGEPLSVVGGTERSYLDADVQAGITYEYRVTATHGPRESQGCPAVSVTAVPFFGSPLGIALATLGSVAAAGLFLRRR